MFLQTLPDLFFQIVVSRSERLVHRYWYDFFPVAGQGIRNVFQADERAVVHQIFAEEKWRSAGPTFDRDSCLRFLGAGVVFDRDALYGLDHTKVVSETFAPGRAP